MHSRNLLAKDDKKLSPNVFLHVFVILQWRALLSSLIIIIDIITIYVGIVMMIIYMYTFQDHKYLIRHLSLL